MPAPRDSCCGPSVPIAKPAKDPRGAHDAKEGLSWERVEQFPAMPNVSSMMQRRCVRIGASLEAAQRLADLPFPVLKKPGCSETVGMRPAK